MHALLSPPPTAGQHDHRSGCCECVCVYAGVANIVRGNPFIQVEHSGILVCTRHHCVPWLTPLQFPFRIAALRFVCLFTRGSTRYSGANPPLAHCVAYLCGGARAATQRLCQSECKCLHLCKWQMANANGERREGGGRMANAAAKKDVGSVI